jgi:hypothetical protein
VTKWQWVTMTQQMIIVVTWPCDSCCLYHFGTVDLSWLLEWPKHIMGILQYRGCVTAVTENSSNEEQTELIQTEPDLICLSIDSLEGMSWWFEPGRSKRDSGSGIPSGDINAQLMEKLCKWALVLIKHKVGTDVDVSDHMVQALEEWLRRCRISIYTESFL